MLIYTILPTIHGEEDLICQKRWHTHIWEWQQMADTFTWFQDNMVHSAEGLLPVCLYLIPRQSNGRTCFLYPSLGIFLIDDFIRRVRLVLKKIHIFCMWITYSLSLYFNFTFMRSRYHCANLHLYELFFYWSLRGVFSNSNPIVFYFILFPILEPCIKLYNEYLVIELWYHLYTHTNAKKWIPTIWSLLAIVKWDIMGSYRVLFSMKVAVLAQLMKRQ